MRNDGTTRAHVAVAQTSKPAVSLVSKPANVAATRTRSNFPSPADLEIDDTAGLETGATSAVRHSSFVILLFALLATSCTTRRLEVTSQPDRLILTHAGQPIAHYVFQDDKILRPHFTHVRTLDGIQVTRRHPPVPGEDAVDHPTMHPGLWLAFGDLAGHDFWRNKAVIRHERFTEPASARGDTITFATTSSLLTSNGATLGRMDSRFMIRFLADGWLLSWTAAITPSVDDFYFGDQEEMGFGVRVATPLAEKNAGSIITSEGLRGAKASWGQTAAWSDCSGVISNRTVGVTLLAAPENFRPSWFHNRDYGLMVANPFGRKAFTKGEPSRVSVAKGETFTLRGGFFIHSGDRPDLAAAHKLFSTP